MPVPDPRAEQTVAQVLASRAARHGDKPFIVTDHGSHSYGDMERASNRLAHGLADLGIAAGETVLVMLPNIVEFITLWCGLAKLGALQVPVNAAYRGDIFVHVVNDSGATTMIVHESFVDRLVEVRPGLRPSSG